MSRKIPFNEKRIPSNGENKYLAKVGNRWLDLPKF